MRRQRKRRIEELMAYLEQVNTGESGPLEMASDCHTYGAGKYYDPSFAG